MSVVEERAADIEQPEPPTLAGQFPEAERGGLSIAIGLEGLALGGVPINALDLAAELTRRGNSVNVFAIDEQVRVSILPQAERRGIPITLLPQGSPTIPRARQISAFADRHEADVIHVFAPWLGPAATIAAMAHRRRVAVVTNWMMANVDYTPQCTPLILGTRRLQVEAQAGHRSPVWLLEPPVDLTSDHPDPELGRRFRAELGVEEDDIAVVIVGRVDRDLKAEGIGHAIDAVRKLDIPQLRLIVVGDGNAFTTLSSRAEAVNAALGRPAVIMAGARQNPRPAYAGADICLGMGGSAIRSLAHGKPLIVLGEHGFARRFEPSTAEYFYTEGFFGAQPGSNPVSHLANMLRATLDETDCQRLGEFGLAEVRGRFGLVSSASRLEGMYRSALDLSSPHRASRWLRCGQLVARAAAHQLRVAVRRSG